MQTKPSAARVQITAMRRLFWAAGVLAFIAGIQLFVLSEDTAHYFAWTIEPPLMAAFLGGAFWAGALGVWLAARQPFWSQARPFLFGATTFTVLILITTLLHLDRFHLSSSDGLAFVLALVWLAVYIGLPPIVLILLARQLQRPGGPLPGRTPLSPLVRIVLLGAAVVTLLVGAGLFLAPQQIAPFWPWSLTPLTAQAVASVLLTLAVSSALVAWENDRQVFRVGLNVFVAGAVLELLALARYLGSVQWDRPLTWLYVLLLLGLLLSSLLSLLTSRKNLY